MDDAILKQCKEIVKAHYGTQFSGLVLYGSMARNEGVSSSDIDLLVLLKEPFDYFRELRTLSDLMYPLQLKSDHLISVKPAAVGEFEGGHFQLYRNGRREGVTL